MKKLIIVVTALFSIFNVYAQGVRFEAGLTWEQVIAKAKAEHKMIFVDCYATWCGPCKEMDANVYPVDSLGQYMNARFISKKIQMDRTKKDDNKVKSWYETAAKFEKDYAIKAYPSFLFFDENGKAVHKSTGYHDVPGLKRLAEKAQDPNQQWYTLMEAYRAGKLPYSRLPELVFQARYALDEPKLALGLAANYMHNYLDKLDEKDFLSKQNITFMDANKDTISTMDRFFNECYHNPAKVDTAMHTPGYAFGLAKHIIAKEVVDPSYKRLLTAKGPEPEWNKLYYRIKTRFGQPYADDIILSHQISWYQKMKDSKNYTHYLVIAIKGAQAKNGIHNKNDVNTFNDFAWQVFLYDEDKTELQTALNWEDSVIQFQKQLDAGTLDTKANLLYKLGRKQEAISLETKATQLDPGDKDIAEVLQKMQAGEPTWPNKME